MKKLTEIEKRIKAGKEYINNANLNDPDELAEINAFAAVGIQKQSDVALNITRPVGFYQDVFNNKLKENRSKK